ncbi:FtsX-like permease family protein [Microbacterium sulfonylureivorans]|uniref:FtsX-like permease family protein n=1 Tax=Microbacterium sulfonylureivorans TaxID=2486854 RepID=UPI000FD8113D|nr:FtsX-like permease family protein [Microbacterium sulfonylureivorans]
MTATLDAPALVEPGAGTDAAPRRRGGWTRWLVAARLARRQAWRAKGSSALVMLLVFLPVSAMAGGAIFWQSHVPTREQAATLELGRHEAWIEVVGGPDPSRWQAVDQAWEWGVDWDEAGMPANPELPAPADPISVIPPGVTVHELRETGSIYVETATGTGRVGVTSGPVWDAAFAGRFVMLDGTAPREPDEAMVSPGLLARIGADLGDEIHLVDSDRDFTVTGTMRRADTDSAVPELFLPPSAADLVEESRQRWYVEDWQPGLDDVDEMNRAGFIVFAHDLVLNPPAGARTSVYATRSADTIAMLTVGLMVAVFAGYLVVLLAGAAFAVAARRQQRSLAVAGSVGAARSDVFRIVVMQGTALGAVAGVAGVAAGAGLAWLALEVTDRGSVASFWGNWGYNVPWPLLVGIAVFAVLVGTLAAVAPARAASRGDVLGALRGARRPARLRARRPLWGLALMLVGLAATIAGGTALAVLNAADEVDFQGPMWIAGLWGVIAGPVLLQIGVILAGHWILVAVARPLSRWGLAPRIAGRDAAATPSRVVPAFAAIAGCVFVASFALSATALTATANTRGYFFAAPLHSIVVSLGQNGSEHSDALVAAADELVAPTEPRHTVVVQMPGGHEYDSETGEVLDPSAREFGVAAQPTDECPGCGGAAAFFNGQLSIVEERDLEVLLDHDLSDDDLAAFRSGAALTTSPGFTTDDGQIVVTEWTLADRAAYDTAMRKWSGESRSDDLPGPTAVHELEARSVDLGHSHSAQILVSPATAARLGMPTVPVTLVALRDTPLTTEALDRLTAQAEAIRIDDDAWVSVRQENGPDPVTPWLWGILAAAAVLVVGASAVCLGLARFERRPDDATLSAVGGGPALRRNVNAWQAAVIVGIGTVTGAAIGLIPVWGLSQSAATYFDFADTPWLWLAALALALPVAVTAVAWLVPPRHPDLTRRTAIT